MNRFIQILLILGLISPIASQNSENQKSSRKSLKEKSVSAKSKETQAYLDMLETAFLKLRDTYVDSINETEIIKAGIKGMMSPVDPYTKFLSGSSKDRLDMLRTGKYGGVGIQIGMRRDTLTVLAPMEDSPAYSEGIHSGDQIYKIDSTLTEGMSIRDASELIRGELGSVVVLHMFRPVTKERIAFELTRANIKLNDVPYWGLDENNIGYIRIKKFSKNTAKEFRDAMIDMSKNGMKGLVIDLRGNSGGLLNNAINMLDVITPRGTELLSTRGRIDRANKTISSRRRPIVSSDVPIAVLINRSSASASEILAGVLQDLDRAIIIGQKSFGKGLVQSMFNLNDTTTLKVTTAKYYTPSGRLIQKQDYLNDGFLTDGLDKHDSTFVTSGGRIVKGGGGISPDIEMDINPLPVFVQGLWRSGVFLTFAATYVPMHGIVEPFLISDKIVNDFKVFLNEYEIEYRLPGERELEKLKEKLNSEILSENNSILDNLLFWRKSSKERLTTKIDNYYRKERNRQFGDADNRKWIENGLLREMSRIVSGEKSRIKSGLEVDSGYHKAVEILLDQNKYYDLLTPSDELDNEDQAEEM
ncbi:MAG: S41 family peptidase [Candidatus Marinimicrobia bacterium]|nr:S41 family peptidase [Candidatus Neomarinimicrobiota bacterium]